MDGYLYSGSYDGTIRKWDKNGECLATFTGHSDGIMCLQTHNGHLYSGSADATIRKWDANGNSTVLKGHHSSVRCLAVVNDFLYSGSSDSTIKKWNLQVICLPLSAHKGVI